MSRRVSAGLAALVIGGIVTYGARGSFGLFIKPWEEAFGADRATVSLVSAIGFVALGLSQPFAGRLLDRWGGKLVLLVGLATCSIGLAVAALASELWQAIVGAGVIASAGAGFASLSTMSFIAAGMVARRTGVAFGVLTAAAAGGQVIVLPIATAVLNVSLQASMAMLALLVAVAFLIATVAVAPTPPTGTGGRGSVMGDLASIAKTQGFWFLLIPFFICGYTSTGLTDTHLIPYATDHHLSEATASAALATLAAFNVIGVLVSGVLTDRVDRGKMLAFTYVARAAILLLLPALTSSPALFVFAAFFGLADFATVPPTTSLTRSVCVAGGWGFALSLISAAHQVGSALGAWAGGWFYTQTGSYDLSFSTGAAALLVGAGLSWFVRSGARPAPRSAPVIVPV